MHKPLGVGHDVQAAVLTDDDECPGDPLLQLAQRAITPAYLLIRYELQGEWVGQFHRQLPENLGLHQRGHLHVLGTPRIEPITIATRPELVGLDRHHIKVPVEGDAELRSRRATGVRVVCLRPDAIPESALLGSHARHIWARAGCGAVVDSLCR
jgi:hypothetical protein